MEWTTNFSTYYITKYTKIKENASLPFPTPFIHQHLCLTLSAATSNSSSVTSFRKSGIGSVEDSFGCLGWLELSRIPSSAKYMRVLNFRILNVITVVYV